MSSNITAEIPNLSIVLIFMSKCSIWPPVSPSNISGLVVTSKIWSIADILCVYERDSLSGFPKAVESVNELDQKPSNPIFFPFFLTKAVSAIIAEIGLCDSINLDNFFDSTSLLKVPLLMSAVIDVLSKWLINAEDEIPLV